MSDDLNNKTLPEILKPYFAYEWEMCVLCGHQRDCHWWNGAGNPNNAGWDACKYHKCECKGAFDKQGYLKTFTEVRYEKQLPEVQEAIAKELMGCLPEKYRMTNAGYPCPACNAEQGELHTDCPIEHAQKITKVAHDSALDKVRARLTAFIGEENT